MAQIPQLRAEVLEEYYKHATFAVSIRPRRTCSYLPHQSDSIGHCNVPKIRHLELRYGSLLVIGITMSNQVERIRLDRDDEDAVCSETGSRHILTMKKAKDFAKVLRRNEDQVSKVMGGTAPDVRSKRRNCCRGLGLPEADHCL